MDVDFLRRVWGRQNPGPLDTMYLGELSRRPDTYGLYTERPLVFGNEINPQQDGVDLFFAPNLFRGARKNENMVDSMWLYADLDEAPYPDIEPTWYWTTSPGNTQALWLLETPVNHQRHATLNKALTAYTGADVGGWHASKLLRVPGSYNYKRGCVVSAATHVSVSNTTDTIGMALAPYITYREASSEEWQPIIAATNKEGVEEYYWDRMGLLSRSMLRRGGFDRSKHIVMMIHQLLGEGFSKQEVFELIWPQAWNKWRADSHRPHMLAREIMRAKS